MKSPAPAKAAPTKAAAVSRTALPTKRGGIRKSLSVIKILIKKSNADDCFGLAAEIAYTTLLSLFPALLLFVSLLSLIQSPKAINIVSDLIGSILPPEIYSPIDKTIEKLAAQKEGEIFTLSLLLSIWSASAVFITIMKSMERIYATNLKYNYFQKQWIAIQLVFIVSVALLVVFNLLIFGVQLEYLLETKYRMRWLKEIIKYTRYPIAFIVMVLSMVLIYKFSLRVGQRLSQILPGAILMAVCWMVLCAYFGMYVQQQSFNQAYGVLGKGIAVMVWLYFNSLIFLIGAEVNSLFYNDIVRFKGWRLHRVMGEYKVKNKNLIEIFSKHA